MIQVGKPLAIRCGYMAGLHTPHDDPPVTTRLQREKATVPLGLLPADKTVGSRSVTLMVTDANKHTHKQTLTASHLDFIWYRATPRGVIDSRRIRDGHTHF